jgi:hypothetical protein
MSADHSTITCTQVSEDRRLDVTAKIFGLHFPLAIEPAIYMFADRLSSEYRGGYWHFHELGNGGFYMAPEDDSFEVVSENGYSGSMSADAFGLCCCLYAYSHISFTSNMDLAELSGRHYHLLRDFMMEHSEINTILAAID